MSLCGLCLQPAKLCRSHIIPEFMYKTLYDAEDHRFYPITENPDAPKHYKKGIREYLFCQECEAKLNVWESYFSQQRQATIKFLGQPDSRIAVAKGLDYPKFKLFQMSLIWRAGIAEHLDFSNVDLGPHSEKLRQMIYQCDPGEPWEYGCVLIFTPHYAEILSQMIMLGEARRFDGHRCYNFLMAGLTWVFVISTKTKYIHEANRVFIDKDGSLPLVVDDDISKRYFEKKFSDLVEIKRRQINSKIG